MYVSNVSGNQDIYLQGTTGQNPINLTKDSPSNDTMPAFSPDGELIAFRSERDGGGLFVMGATGESVRRVTRFGFNPAWSPDSGRLVFATERVTDLNRTPGVIPPAADPSRPLLMAGPESASTLSADEILYCV